MAILPYSRVVDVTVTRQDDFPTRRGFETIMILTTDDGASSNLTAANRSATFSSLSEVAVEYAAGTPVHRVASAIFAQNPRPRRVKVGLLIAASLNADFEAVYNFDPDFYWVLPAEGTIMDAIGKVQTLANSISAKNLQLGFDTNDVLTEDAANATNMSALLKALNYDRVSSYYHTDTTLSLGGAAFAYGARRNLDQRDQAYTLKFKNLQGISNINKVSAIVQAITGFNPGIGLDKTQGHLANTYVNIGGVDMLVEGNTFGGTFVDVIHATDWIRARVQEEVLGVLTTNAVVPYTDRGMQLLVAAVEGVMQRAVLAGVIADLTDGENVFLPAYEITYDPVSNVPASQRANRIAPDIQACIRFAGAIHWSQVNITMKF